MQRRSFIWKTSRCFTCVSRTVQSHLNKQNRRNSHAKQVYSAVHIHRAYWTCHLFVASCDISCHIPRGDLQTTFLFKGFDEARRLGLNRETEAEVRADLAETADVSVPGANA